MKKQNIKKRLLVVMVLVAFFGGFVSTALPVSYKAQAACVAGDSNGDGDPCDSGENMFNCKADCLPPGVPTKPISLVIRDAISWTLGFAVSISVAIFIWGGVYYVTSSGNTEKAEKAKKIAKYALMGLAVAGISYAILVIISAIFGP